MSETHRPFPYREPGYGIVTWWCEACKRAFLGPEDHDAQLKKAEQ